MSELILGPGFTIDANIATRRAVLLGQPDSGKTNGLTVIAEGLLQIGIPPTVMDWKGDLWGLRSGADGEAAGGYPVVIFGGDHADIAIDEADGREIGHLVADDDLPSVIDLSAFVTDTARRRFATAFLKAFLQAKRNNHAIHPLLIDEYQEFAPERPYGEGVALLGATLQVVGLGRKRGIGVLGTSLRAAQLSKSVVELTDLYLFMQVAGKKISRRSSRRCGRARVPRNSTNSSAASRGSVRARCTSTRRRGSGSSSSGVSGCARRSIRRARQRSATSPCMNQSRSRRSTHRCSRLGLQRRGKRARQTIPRRAAGLKPYTDETGRDHDGLKEKRK